MSQTDLFVTIGSAAVIVLMLSVAWVLGFRQSARLDEAEMARLARAEGANVEAAAIDAKGRAAVAKLNGGKLLIAKVMADGVSTRVLPQGQAQVRLASHKLSITFGDLGYPSLNMRLENPPAWLAELGARP
jgi:Mg2+/citrate symporter